MPGTLITRTSHDSLGKDVFLVLQLGALGGWVPAKRSKTSEKHSVWREM